MMISDSGLDSASNAINIGIKTSNDEAIIAGLDVYLAYFLEENNIKSGTMWIPGNVDANSDAVDIVIALSIVAIIASSIWFMAMAWGW